LEPISSVGILRVKDKRVGFDVIFDYFAKDLKAGAVVIVVGFPIFCSIVRIALRVCNMCEHLVVLSPLVS
jgi:hypothetical protein